MEDIDSICSLDSELSLSSISSVGIHNIFEVIVKTSFSKIAKCLTLIFAPPPEIDEKKQKKQERKMKRAQQPMYR